MRAAHLVAVRLTRHLVLGAIVALGLGTSVQLAAQSSPSDYTSATRYDAMGRVVGTIAPDPDGTGPLGFPATRTTHDQAGRPTLVETGELSVWKSETVLPSAWGSDFTVLSSVETTYDNMGRKETEQAKGSDGVGTSLTQYSYDAVGRLECTARRMDPTAWGSLPNDACSIPTTPGAFGPDRVTQTIYDAYGQVLQIRKAVGTSVEVADVTYTYTANGKIEHVIDANGNRAELRYDGLDRQSQWVFPSKTGPTSFDPTTPASAVQSAGALSTDGPASEHDYEEYTYDDNGNRLTLRKRDSTIITYEYDALNRMTRKTIPDRSDLVSTHERDVFYVYDLRGLQTEARFVWTGGQGIFNTYDGFGRLVSVTDTIDSMDRTFAYEYDRNGNRTKITYPDGEYFTYEHDGLDRVNALKDDQGIALISPTYNSRGLPSALIRNASAHDQTYTYDPVGRLQDLSLTSGNASSNVSWSFTRNPASQILSETQNNEDYSWKGHEVRNTLYATNGLNQYESAQNQYASGGTANFCYDANGNLTADGTYVYLYDVENRLVEMRAQGSGNTNCANLDYAGDLKAELRYDPLGRLYFTYDPVVGGNHITRYAYDGDAMVAEYNWNNVLLDRYVHGTNADADDPLIWYEGTSTLAADARHLYADPRGSIVLISDNSGSAITQNSYDEYGIPSATNTGRFQYTGQVWLEELGMYYYKARIYSPTIGRFLQVDPIGYEDQFNLYAYVYNDPVNGVDPTGEQHAFMFTLGERSMQAEYDNDPNTNGQEAAADFAITASEALPAPTIVVIGPKKVGWLTKFWRRITGRNGDRAQSQAACCFVAGTLVDTENGLRPIETISQGDKVWARDEKTGETALKEVTDLIQRHERVIWEVSLTGPSGEIASFETTDDHPWWVAGQGWRETAQLTTGMAVVTKDGRGMLVASVFETRRTEATYNLTVADFETYFVGEKRILVHNCNQTPSPALRDSPYNPQSVDRRRTQTRRQEGAPSNDPDSPIPDRGAGSDQGGHAARGRTPHPQGQRNVNPRQEHSRRVKGNPEGRPREQR